MFFGASTHQHEGAERNSRAHCAHGNFRRMARISNGLIPDAPAMLQRENLVALRLGSDAPPAREPAASAAVIWFERLFRLNLGPLAQTQLPEANPRRRS